MTDLPVDKDKLLAWMDGRALGDGVISNVRMLSGGTQNIMFRFERDGRRFVFRAPPPHPRAESNTVMKREGVVLNALSGTTVPHPGFIAGCWDTETLGRYFYLMEPVDGISPANALPKPHSQSRDIRSRMSFSYMKGMAALAGVDYQAVGLQDFGKAEGFLERQAGRWLSQIEGYSKFENWTGSEDLGDYPKIAQWLSDNIPTDYRPGIIHGDCHIGNVMFATESGELAAMIDWEMSTIGDPRIDVGWVMATWPSDPEFRIFNIEPWDGFADVSEMVKHYGNVSGRNMDSIDWFGVLACFKLGAILEGTHARASAGKAPKETGDMLHGITINLFKKAHRLMAGG